MKIPGRISIDLSAEVDDEIRHHFHLLLSEMIYPMIAILLKRLLMAHTAFTNRSETILHGHMHQSGFSYKMVSKVKVTLDNNFLVVQ